MLAYAQRVDSLEYWIAVADPGIRFNDLSHCLVKTPADTTLVENAADILE
jgi:hypothetical protein